MALKVDNPVRIEASGFINTGTANVQDVMSNIEFLVGDYIQEDRPSRTDYADSTFKVTIIVERV